MDRRVAVSRIGLILGGAISAPTLSALLSGCTAPEAQDWSPRHFSPEQITLLERMADIIIPETDTPGATEAGAVRFIDTLMAEYYQPEASNLFRSMLDAWEMASDLSSKSSSELTRIIAVADEKVFSGRNASQDQHFQLLKELVISGYYTSEVGMNEELRLKPMGPASMDIPRSDVERSWSD